VIPAGSSGKIVAKVNTKPNQSGSFSKAITVVTDLPDQPVFRLSMSFRTVTPIVGVPRLEMQVEGLADEAITGRLLLRRSDGKRLEVSKAEGSFPIDIAVRTTRGDGGEQPAASDSELWLVVDVPPQPQAQRYSGKLVLETNDPEASQLEVPLTVSVRDIFSVRPQEVQLTVPEEPGSARVIRVRLRHGSRVPFSVTDVEISNPELFSVEVDSERKSVHHELLLTLAKDVSATSLKKLVTATMKVSVSEPRKPVLEIPVNIGTEALLRPALVAGSVPFGTRKNPEPDTK